MAADPVRSCYNSAWWAGLFPVGLVATGVYAAAIPGGVVWVLWRKRRALDGVTFTLRYGFLVGRFSSESWWFEAAIMGRKLMVVVCMTFFFTEEGKAYTAVFALLGSLGHLVYAAPYRVPFHWALAIVVLVATTTVLYSGTFVDFTMRRVGVITGICVNVLAIVVGNVIDIWRISRDEKAMAGSVFFEAATTSNPMVGDSGTFGSEVVSYSLDAVVAVQDHEVSSDDSGDSGGGGVEMSSVVFA